MKKIAGLILVLSLAACGRTEMDESAVASDTVARHPRTAVATATKSDTGSAVATETVTVVATATHTETATATHTVDTATDTGTQTKSVTNSATASTTSTVTASKTDAVTATVTATLTSVSRVPIIATVMLVNIDSQGNPAEDTRRFVIEFNGSAVDIRIKIIESATGAVLVDSPVVANGTKGEQLHVNMDKKLKSATTYDYEVSARSADGACVNSSSTGKFTTAYCFVGEWKYYYTDAAHGTDGVGRCHGAMMECIDNGHGGGMLSGAGEVTPYPWGDKCGDGIDNDCDGKVDNSVVWEVPAGQDHEWSRNGTDGEVIRFNMDGTNASATPFYWLDIQVELKGLGIGNYRLWSLYPDGSWHDLSPLLYFYDASGGGYKPGMLDLSNNNYPGTSGWFVLGIQWKDRVGLTLREGGKISFMLVALPDYSNGKSGTIRHFAPHSESSCDSAAGKTITVPAP